MCLYKIKRLLRPVPSVKVYCENCESYKKGDYTACHHENNMGSYLSAMGTKDMAWDINKNNDCRWFEQIKNKRK